MIQTKMEPFTLPPLPYGQNALEPYISARTLGFHYGKHHQAYVDKLNDLVSGSEFAELKLEEVIAKTSGDINKEAIFNNAAQVWNHTFYWNSLSPEGGGKPFGELGKKIESSFGSYENFIKEFAQAGMDQFGSGWVWIVKEGGLLKITKTSNAGNPISQGRGTALLALDVWEHAYYLDYQNRRNDYLATILDKLINWNFAAENFGRA
jgi:Fe-Mn family superoxide dismutase